jgi:hypothetical protein
VNCRFHVGIAANVPEIPFAGPRAALCVLEQLEALFRQIMRKQRYARGVAPGRGSDATRSPTREKTIGIVMVAATANF